MGGAPLMRASEVEFSDVQGLVRFGFGKMTRAAYLLARIKDVAAAKAWLRTAPITTAVAMSPPPTLAIQVAFTAAGLEALGVAPSVIHQFSHEFVGGMTEPSRARRLGDLGINAPETWDWGWRATMPHLVIMFFAADQLDAFIGRSTGAGFGAAFEVVRRLSTSDLDGVEPFGFADGISQPVVDWEEQRSPALGHQLEYENVVALGEFLLGYPNEYRKVTDRPILDADSSTAMLLPAVDSPDKRDLGKNGTYLVMRQLRQDVRAFWQFVGKHANGNGKDAEQLAAAFVGRALNGDPLVPIQQKPIPGIGPNPAEVRQNQFTFDEDPFGARCPFGSHVRRVNPRNADLPGHPNGLAKLAAVFGLGRDGFRDDLTSSVRFHRVVRRGREYGPGLSPADALEPATPNEAERGLHFLCLNANISRQFEFLQNAWVMNTKFSGLTGASDPLLGTRAAIPGCPSTSDFALEQEGMLRRRVAGLPQFVTVRGGAYFFLPSLRALQYFSA